MRSWRSRDLRISAKQCLQLYQAVSSRESPLQEQSSEVPQSSLPMSPQVTLIPSLTEEIMELFKRLNRKKGR